LDENDDDQEMKEAKKDIFKEMMKLKNADKLDGIMEYGHHTKGLEDKKFDSLYMKSKVKGIRQNTKPHGHANRFKQRCRKFNKKGRKRNGFTFQFVDKCDSSKKKSMTKIFPVGDRLNSGVPLNGKHEENKDPTGV
jgi:hypothetical protein